MQGDVLMSGSIDLSNKIFNLNNAIGKYNFAKEVKYHEQYVMDICPQVGGTGFLSAARDKKIILIDADGNPAMEYLGHE